MDCLLDDKAAISSSRNGTRQRSLLDAGVPEVVQTAVSDTVFNCI